MATSSPTRAAGETVTAETPTARHSREALSILRSLVGVGSWASPVLSWRTFGLGSMHDDPRAAVITRLFAVRDLALGQAVRHPNAQVRRAALQVGVAVDAVDVVASLVALRKGAPKVTWLTFVGGAALFVGLGVAALADERTTGGDSHDR